MAESTLARLDERIQALQLDVGGLLDKIDTHFHDLIELTTRVTKVEMQVTKQEHFMMKVFDSIFKLAVIAGAGLLGFRHLV